MAVGVEHGFVLSGGIFTLFDFPGSVVTEGGKINSKGEIVGLHSVAGPDNHGFLAE